MDFRFTRGDTKKFKFKLEDANGNLLKLGAEEQLYLTVKTSSSSKEVIFQKRIDEGIVYGDDGYYHVTINSDDTADLYYRTYGYDIELRSGELTKTIIIGSITLTDEFTHKGDEK